MGSIYTINVAVCAQRCLSFICDAVRSYCETLSEVLSGCRERAAFDWLERDGHRSCCSVLRRSGFSRPSLLRLSLCSATASRQSSLVRPPSLPPLLSHTFSAETTSKQRDEVVACCLQNTPYKQWCVACYLDFFGRARSRNVCHRSVLP